MTASDPSSTTSTVIEYRLTWESIDSHYAAAFEAQYGKDAWPKLSEKQWAALPWNPPIQRIGMSDIFDQRNTLMDWARTHEQPIRNVVFEQRAVPNPDEGWEADRG